jgi:hypothetical protein
MEAKLGNTAMAILMALCLTAQTALADESLLRGPRRAVREQPPIAAAEQGILERIASAPVRFYQQFLAEQWAPHCAYYPSCSHYAIEAIRKHGAVVGSIMAFDRLQHEGNEARYSPRIIVNGEIKVYDPLENNDNWWYTSVHQ